ncbi:MCE family protein [Nocardioides sp. AE5]|uniref:MCE family protein n=1 Tax=Nocardioides sp. AE5 TaxID=2962573 RepID=UPI0028819EA9|nr:MCE family protein [Nocardioides sp. AE5]MDT0201410.1 MCE family protein [Nocardioides sp. AE5]
MARGKTLVPPATRGAIILVVCLCLLGLILAKSFGKFDKTLPGSVNLDTAGGALQVGAEVKLDGVVVGKVTAIDPAEQGVRVALEFDPERAEKVPGNVTVRVLPVSIFGAAFVELLRPESPQGALASNAVLKQDESATTVELGDLLEETLALVDALGPAELANMLETFASTLDGKGEQIGEMIETADRVVARVQPVMPLIRQDIRLATIVMTTLSRITPNLFTALDGLVALSHTMIDMESEFAQVLTSLDQTSTKLDTVVTKNQQALEYGVPYLARVVNALYAARGDIPRTFDAVISLATRAAPAFSYGPYMRIDADLRLTDEPEYGRGDCPTYGGLRGVGC